MKRNCQPVCLFGPVLLLFLEKFPPRMFIWTHTFIHRELGTLEYDAAVLETYSDFFSHDLREFRSSLLFKEGNETSKSILVFMRQKTQYVAVSKILSRVL